MMPRPKMVLWLRLPPENIDTKPSRPSSAPRMAWAMRSWLMIGNGTWKPTRYITRKRSVIKIFWRSSLILKIVKSWLFQRKSKIPPRRREAVAILSVPCPGCRKRKKDKGKRQEKRRKLRPFSLSCCGGTVHEAPIGHVVRRSNQWTPNPYD